MTVRSGLLGALLLVIAFGARPVGADGEATPADPAAALRAEVTRALARVYQATGAPPAPGTPPAGDACFDAALHAAFADAGDGPVGARAALIALAIFVDDSGMYTDNPLAGRPYAALVPEAVRGTRQERARVATLQGRHDWAQHFAVSAALAAQLTPELSLQAGLAKELSDARGMEQGAGSGFSFADLGADLAGIELARRLLRDDDAARATRQRLAAGGSAGAVCPDLTDLPEDLPFKTWREQYGGLKDPRYAAMTEKIRRRIDACAAYAPLAPTSGEAR